MQTDVREYKLLEGTLSVDENRVHDFSFKLEGETPVRIVISSPIDLEVEIDELDETTKMDILSSDAEVRKGNYISIDELKRKING